MRLIMNEVELTENILETNNIPDGISDKYLIKLLIRYNKNNIIIKKELINHIHEITKKLNVKNYVEYKFYKKIQRYTTEELKTENPIELKQIKYVPLYENELEKIKYCKTDREKKFLFVCYIMARFNNSNWFNIEDRELFKMANITLTWKERQKFIYNMIQNDYIFHSRNNTNISLGIKLDNSGKEILKIINLDNLGNQILAFLKPNYILCNQCQKLIKINSKHDGSTKYCDKCAYEIKLEQNNKYYHEKQENS